MIFSARSRLPASAASHAWSASLRARRRSFSFCFFGFIRSSSVRSPGHCPFGAARNVFARLGQGSSTTGTRWSAGHPFRGGRALTEEDLGDHSHTRNCTHVGGPHKVCALA